MLGQKITSEAFFGEWGGRVIVLVTKGVVLEKDFLKCLFFIIFVYGPTCSTQCNRCFIFPTVIPIVFSPKKLFLI